MKSLAWRMRSLTWGSGWGEREHQCHVDSYTENNRKWVSGKASADTRKSMWSGNSSARGDRASFIKQIAQNAFWWTEWDPQPEVGCWREIARERERERARERASKRAREREREREKRERSREGLGFQVLGLRFRVQGFGFGVWGFGFGVLGLGFRVSARESEREIVRVRTRDKP